LFDIQSVQGTDFNDSFIGDSADNQFTGGGGDDVMAKIEAASRTYGLAVDPKAVVATLPFGLRQRVEIVKAILRGVKLLILDEPTSNLSPLEVASLLSVIRRLKQQGHSVVFISHKLAEVIEICDEVVVLRDGAVSGRAAVAEVTREGLARMMVERDLSAPVTRSANAAGDPVLTVEGLSHRDVAGTARVDGVSFAVRAGEILAVAGVDGNGQADLLDTLAGILPAHGGRIVLDGRDITHTNVRRRLAAGLAYIPVDRGNTGLVLGMSITDNLAVRDFDRAPLSRGPLLRLAAMRAAARERLRAFDIRAADVDVPARTLSGGNQQKVVLAREIGRRPRMLMAFQPTWGLDPGATRFVIDQMLALRDAGCAVLYVSSELEEVLMLGDRIAVMYGGRLSQPVPRRDADIKEIGLMMAGLELGLRRKLRAQMLREVGELVFVLALELSRFDPRAVMDDPLGKQKANRKFSVRSRCPHRNRDWLLNHTWTAPKANADLKRLFNCQCIADILRRSVRNNAFNDKPL